MHLVATVSDTVVRSLEDSVVPQDTKTDLMRHLDQMTRELGSSNYATFTTMRIASECHVSRSLASQYLNELVRAGMVVKVNERPVLFFHRVGLERYLQHKVLGSEYDSIRDMLVEADLKPQRDFDKAIGASLSCGSCVEHLKSAMRYPPHGLPVLLVGEHGTGKQLMGNLMFEFGVNGELLPASARYVEVDCARYELSDSSAELDIFGGPSHAGAIGDAAGGVVFLNRFDHLSHAVRETILHRIAETGDSPSVRRAPARFVLSTARSLDNTVVKMIARAVPIVVSLPRLADRSVEERTELAMHFLRAEGRRVAADVQISRGALRALVSAEFEDNIDGLRSCITNCCARAYLSRERETLTIHMYNLPPELISLADSRPDDDQLVQGNVASDDPFERIVALFQRMIDPVASYRSGAIGFGEFMANASVAVRSYGDHMNFHDQTVNPRIGSYEQLMSPIVEEVNRAYGIELTRRVPRLIAQSIFIQMQGVAWISSWHQAHAEGIDAALSILSKNLQDASVVVEQIAAKTRSALGIMLDDLSLSLLYVAIADEMRASGGLRDYLGIIMCHGYSTATSIADAVDRILHRHVFEAIDMTYDQDLSDAVGQLSRLLKRFSHCSTVAILVDTGSLESIDEAVGGLAGCEVHIANNVSTSLALEVGNALVSHEDLDSLFERVREICVPRHRVVQCSNVEDAVVFCSELGIETADKIRKLIQESIPGDSPVQLLTADYAELQRDGDAALVFSQNRVRAVLGTTDPGTDAAPFVALEDILYHGSSDAIDDILFNALGPDGISEFHANLLRNLTLRNVLESITILNPETLYIEADRAVRRLEGLSCERIDAQRKIGLYVHLCGMIERLVTKNFVDTYPDVDKFVRDYGEFIDWFRKAFDGMSRRYRVEIPVSEIAYVHHMLHVRMAEKDERARVMNVILDDE